MTTALKLYPNVMEIRALPGLISSQHPEKITTKNPHHAGHSHLHTSSTHLALRSGDHGPGGVESPQEMEAGSLVFLTAEKEGSYGYKVKEGAYTAVGQKKQRRSGDIWP